MAVKTPCPGGCEELVVIIPTGKKKHSGFSAEWWEIVPHDKHGQRCPGSGKQV